MLVPAMMTVSDKTGAEIPVWNRREARTQKAKRFFGADKVPLDVSVAEIQRFGLPALLQSNIPLCYFLYNLMENYCSENLFFYLEAESYRTHQWGQDKEHMQRTAQNIYKYFIKQNSEFEVNLESRIVKPIKKAIDNFDKDCFLEAQEHVVHLLEPLYIDFTMSPAWKQMVEDIGLNTTIYSHEQRNRAVSMLVKHFDKSLESEEKGIHSSDAAVAAERGRARLIRNLAHVFCKTKLGCDFSDKEDGQMLETFKPKDMARSASRPF